MQAWFTPGHKASAFVGISGHDPAQVRLHDGEHDPFVVVQIGELRLSFDDLATLRVMREAIETAATELHKAIINRAHA